VGRGEPKEETKEHNESRKRGRRKNKAKKEAAKGVNNCEWLLGRSELAVLFYGAGLFPCDV
jgi:hypothetical protein